MAAILVVEKGSSMNLLSKRWLILVGLILILATVLRLYKIGEVPHGMSWDEAAIGYNGYAVWTTRRDEWLNRLPTSFRSFGDYKAPLPIYLNGFFTVVFGMNLWAVRLPFALAGVAAVGGMILLTYQLLERKSVVNKEENVFLSAASLSLLAGLLIALSPWHIHFSRIGFESGIALCFLIWSLVFLLRLNQVVKAWQRFFNIGATSTFLAAALYSYHSTKIVVPLLVLLFIFLKRKVFWIERKSLLCVGVLTSIGLLPLIQDSLFGHGADRFWQSTIFTLPLSPVEKLEAFIYHFSAHISPAFLSFGWTNSLRHGDGHWGVLLPTTFLLVVAGVLSPIFLRKKISVIADEKQLWLIAVGWILIGLLPAAIGRDIPHSNRALLALPGFLLLAVAGADSLWKLLQPLSLNQRVNGTKSEKELLVKSVVGTWLLLHCLFSLSYLHRYYGSYQREVSVDFLDGYLEVMEYAKQYEPEVERILFTDFYQQPYIFALFSRKTNPIWYHGGSLVKYEFSRRINEGDLGRKNVLIIATPSEIPAEKAMAVVRGTDGKVRFTVTRTPNEVTY